MSHNGVGLGEGDFGTAAPGFSPPPASQPATPNARAATAASTARARRPRLRVACAIRRLPERPVPSVPSPNP
ncbi:hypothetical protein GCM10018771_40150 [Streptomyces cellulosae]|nr:hypothetical protein GCM10018771_40150 [Streptomyces cellulosae]